LEASPVDTAAKRNEKEKKQRPPPQKKNAKIKKPKEVLLL